MTDTDKRVAFVIGAGSGIGAAVAKDLRQHDRIVFAPNVDIVDVRVGSTVGEYVKSLYDHEFVAHKGMDVVYSAGVTELEWIGDLSEHALRQIWEVNVNGFLRLLDALRHHKFESCRIVAITSDAAVRPMRTSIAYCASKAALDMAVRCAARELAEFGYRVNGIAPGMVDNTPMTHYIDRTVPEIRGWNALDALDYEMSQMVVKRRVSTGEIAQMVRQVLEAPDYLNGAIIPVNGGR